MIHSVTIKRTLLYDEMISQVVKNFAPFTRHSLKCHMTHDEFA